MKKLFLATLLYIIFFAKAYANISLIRDAQTEKFLRELSHPIFQAAKLDPNNINIYIVNDSSINAFVSGGQNVFINTGLIMKYKTPDALIGVVAHETGHIKAGHIARSYEEYKKAQNSLLLSYLLGIGAVVAGSPDAGMAIITGSGDTIGRLLLKYTRSQEEAADYHAIQYLREIKYPITGLRDLLQYFQSQMVGYQGQIDEYLLSHPVSKKRIDLIDSRTKNDHFSNHKINAKLQRQMDIVLKKLEGFIAKPSYTLNKYHSQNSELAKYVKAIAYFRLSKIDTALLYLDALIANNNNKEEKGFLYELKGQILFESGDIKNSTIAYNKAIKLLKDQDSSQAKITFATAILNLEESDEELINIAINNLEEAKIYEKNTPFLYKQLANAYSQINKQGLSFLNLAEFNLLIGKKEKALKYAKKAKEEIDEADKINILRAEDLIELSKKDKKD